MSLLPFLSGTGGNSDKVDLIGRLHLSSPGYDPSDFRLRWSKIKCFRGLRPISVWFFQSLHMALLQDGYWTACGGLGFVPGNHAGISKYTSA